MATDPARRRPVQARRASEGTQRHCRPTGRSRLAEIQNSVGSNPTGATALTRGHRPTGRSRPSQERKRLGSNPSVPTADQRGVRLSARIPGPQPGGTGSTPVRRTDLLGAHVRWGARLSCKQLAVGSIPTVSTEDSPVVQSVGWGAVNAQIQVRALVGELSRQGSLAARQRTVNPPDVGSTPTPALTTSGR